MYLSIFTLNKLKTKNMSGKITKKYVKEVLTYLMDSGWDYIDTSENFDIEERKLRKWWNAYAGKFLGEKTALKHNSMKNVGFEKMHETTLTPIQEENLSKEKQEILREKFRRDVDVQNAEIIVAAEGNMVKQRELISTEAAKVQLAAIERLNDILDVITSENLIKAIEVLDKIRGDADEGTERKTNQFINLIKKQVIVNKQ